MLPSPFSRLADEEKSAVARDRRHGRVVEPRQVALLLLAGRLAHERPANRPLLDEETPVRRRVPHEETSRTREDPPLASGEGDPANDQIGSVVGGGEPDLVARRAPGEAANARPLRSQV